MNIMTKDENYIHIHYNGNSASYPCYSYAPIRYTPKSAWKDFYRTLRIYKEAVAPAKNRG